MAWLLLAHAVALAVFAWFTVRYEAPLNVRMITDNGSADDLKRGFHQRRTWVRFWWWLSCLVLGSAPLLWLGLAAEAIYPVAALGALLAVFFLRTFGPLLNHGLKLSYKSRFYASPKSDSFPDAYVWRHVRRGFPDESDEALQDRANFINQWFLNMWLGGGLALYTGFMVAYFL